MYPLSDALSDKTPTLQDSNLDSMIGYLEITKSPESTGGPNQNMGASHYFQQKNPK